MTIEEMTERMQRVYLYTGRVAHLINLDAPIPEGSTDDLRPAICKMRPLWPGKWFGRGGNEEIAAALSLPICNLCQAVREASVRNVA